MYIRKAVSEMFQEWNVDFLFFSFLFLEMRFVFDNSIVQASSKYSSCLLAVTIGGNLDEPRLSKPVFHWTVPTYRSRYNCSKANIRD